MLNPYNIPPDHLPLIVFSDMTSGLMEWAIKWRTKGSYNHVMFLYAPGQFVSQGNTYSMVPVDRYMKRGNRLKFVSVSGLDDVCRAAILASIEKKLKLPWWRKLYDWPGIVGQALGFKRLNIGGLNYCSEDVALHLTKCVDLIPPGALHDAIAHIPLHGSPKDLNEYFKRYPDHFAVYGRWDSDELRP